MPDASGRPLLSEVIDAITILYGATRGSDGGGGIYRAALTGDVTVPDTSNVATLAASGVAAGSYVAPTVTFDAKGRATAAASASAFIQTLLDDANAAAFLTTLGVSAYAQTLLDDANAAAAQTTLGISAFIQTLLDDANAAAALVTLTAAPLASPTFTGTPAAPTAAPGTNTTQVATTAFVQAALGATVFAQTRTIEFDDADIDVADTSVDVNFPAVAAGSVLLGISTDVTTGFADGEGPITDVDASILLPDGTTWTRDMSGTSGLDATPYVMPHGSTGTEIAISAVGGNLDGLTQGAMTITLYFALPTYTTIPVP